LLSLIAEYSSTIFHVLSGVKLCYCLLLVLSRLAEALLLYHYHAILVDEERRDASITMLRGICKHCESARHLPIEDVVLRAALGIKPLARVVFSNPN